MFLTAITPTTGKPSLLKLIDSIDKQSSNDVFHLLVWDNKREINSSPPESFNSETRFSIIAPPGSGRNIDAPGSILRSIGLMAASSEWCTFADDDVWWDDDHLSNIRTIAKGYKWGSTLRKIWSSAGEFLGIDKFESVGDDPTRTVPYEMCDNNTIFFRRELGVAAAHLYRETKQYNDDRLMYQFLKHVGGERGRTGVATVNHICPDRLIPFFRTNCVKPEKPLNRNSLCPCGSGKKYKHCHGRFV